MSGDHRRDRVILPRTALQEETALPESSTTPGPTRPSPILSTRTNIRSACLGCRRRRSRCSGGQPCNRCRALDTECVYSESQDGRTRALREKSREELEMYKKVINGVYQAVRDGKEQGLLELFRTEAAIETIAAAVEESNMESWSESASEILESQPFGAQEQGDRPSGSRSQLYRSEAVDQTQHLGGQRTDPSLSLSSAAKQPQESSRRNAAVLHETLVDQDSKVMGMRHLLEPLHSPDRSDLQRLSSLYVNLRDAAKQMIAQGIPSANILGSTGISCNMLLGSQQPPFGVSTWASVVVNSVQGVDILFRLAWLCYLTRFMRWAIEPTEQHFQLMPEAMIPTSVQLSVPHAPAIDLIPIPQIRDATIQNFRDFTASLELAGATVYWPDSIDDAIDQDPVTGNMTVSTRFERHINNTDKFCFGRSLLRTYPELEGQVQIAEQDHILSVSSFPSPTIPALEPANDP